MLQAFLEINLDGTTLIDGDGRFKSLPTSSISELLGYGPDELVGRSIFDLIHPEDVPAIQELFGQLLKDPQTPLRAELRFRHKNGAWRWLEGRGKNLLAEPTVQAIVGSYRDITEAKQAAEALRKSEQRLEYFFNQSLDGFFFMMLDAPVRWDDTVDKEAVLDYVFDRQRLTKVNEAMLAQYGAQREQLIGRTPRDFFAHDLAYGRKLWRQMFDAGRLQIETEERKLDGTPIWIDGDYICFCDAAGQITGHFGVQRNVTERKKAFEALRASEAYARNLIESSLDMIIAVDNQRKIVEFNRAAERTFGYSRAEVMGRSVDLLYANVRDGLAVNDETIEHGRSIRTVINRRKNGEEFQSLLDASVLRDGRGQVIGVMGISRDITESKRLETALRTKTEQLAAVVEAMTNFLQHGDWREVSASLLREALKQTESEYGFVGVLVEGPALRVLAHEGIRWHSTIGRAFYEKALQEYRERGYLEFRNFNNLFGAVITTGQTVVSNEPDRDPRSGGLPPGHPPLRSFLGVPIRKGGEIFGMVGIANRPAGYSGSEQDKIRVLAETLSVLYESYRRQERERALVEERDRVMAALHEAQNDLERRVQERTAEFVQVNTRLEEEIRERRGAEEQIKRALEEKEVLLREVYHRTKNNLQVISSLFELQIYYGRNPALRRSLLESQSRLQSMALIHEKLYQAQDLSRIDFGAYVRDLVNTLCQTYEIERRKIQIEIAVERVALGLDTAVPCGLILNELVSNALRHGFPGDRTGVVKVQLAPLTAPWFELVVSDNGVGLPDGLVVESAETLGLNLVANLAKQLRGSVGVRRNGGTEFRVRFQEVKYQPRR